MKDPKDVLIDCNAVEDIVHACNVASREIRPELRQLLNSIFTSYLCRFGIAGVFERLHNKTVAQAIAEYDADESVKPVISGEVDGLKFELFGKPEGHTGGMSNAEIQMSKE